jgi:hypothetical protein
MPTGTNNAMPAIKKLALIKLKIFVFVKKLDFKVSFIFTFWRPSWQAFYLNTFVTASWWHVLLVRY